MAQALQHHGPGAKTLIVGLGSTGLSCARHLAKQGVPEYRYRHRRLRKRGGVVYR